MKADVMKLQQSLNPCMYQEYFQWDIMRYYAGYFGIMFMLV